MNVCIFVDGLIKAISILDDVVKTIRASKDKSDAKNNLIKQYAFSEKASRSNCDATTLSID